MLEPRQRVGRFELLSFLGKGGMGEVWRARDPVLGRDVALKVLSATVARDGERVSRFEREARALAALNHPHVAQIYEVGEWVPPGGAEPLRFLVMELVSGESLAGRVGAGAAPPAEAVRVMRQVASALAAAHARGVIHRDLKPANILLAADGTVKVVDFGLARFFRSQDRAGGSDITQAVSSSGLVVGTASYMAPEQVRGQECDEKCDVWAFGCCLGELLMGRRVFDGTSIPEIIGKILGSPPDLSAVPGSVPRSLRRLVQRCLEQDRLARPTMSEVMEALAEADGRRGRRRWPIAVAAAAAALVLGWAGAGWWRGRGEIRRAKALAGDLRVAVLAPSLARHEPGGDGPADRVADRLLLSLARAKGVQAVVDGGEDLRVRVRAAGEGVGERIHVSIEDHRRGTVVAVVDERVGGGGFDATVEVVAEAVAGALQLEGIRREMEGEDALHGFLVRRTAVLDAARAFRDGLHYYTRTRLPQARELLEHARDADPQFWPAYVYLAQIAGSEARFREGRTLLEQCRALLHEPQRAELAVVEVAEALLSEDLQRLLEALERARRFFPDSGELLYRTAWTYRSIDRPERAIPLLEELLRSNWQPDWSPTREQLAMNQLLDGQLTAALATAAEGEERFPERFQYPLYAAFALQLRGEQAAARVALTRAIRKRLDFSTSDRLATHQTAQWWASLLRWGEEAERQWREVLHEAERRLVEAPGDPALLLAKGEALRALGQSAKALDVLDSFRGDRAGEPYRLLARARARVACGDEGGARDDLLAVAAIWQSRNAPALGTLAYNIGCVWCVVGDAEEALRWFLRARDQYGLDRLDLALDPELDLLRQQGLLETLGRR